MTFDEILRRHLKYLEPGAEIGPDAPLRELGLDSMEAVELVFDLEDELGVALPDAAMTADTFATVRSLRAAVMEAV